MLIFMRCVRRWFLEITVARKFLTSAFNQQRLFEGWLRSMGLRLTILPHLLKPVGKFGSINGVDGPCIWLGGWPAAIQPIFLKYGK